MAPVVVPGIDVPLLTGPLSSKSLSSRKRHTTFQRTSGVINKLIRFSVETGSVTSVGALVEATLWLTCRQWNFHFIFFLVLGKLQVGYLGSKYAAELDADIPICSWPRSTAEPPRSKPTAWEPAASLKVHSGLNQSSNQYTVRILDPLVCAYGTYTV
ncbi:hypothetical protein B0H11DRAFT_1905977 [Mycena galericulata]|nr:hypothetical protein B0H11DRAFT_1905977 [Mycena galericulata]